MLKVNLITSAKIIAHGENFCYNVKKTLEVKVLNFVCKLDKNLYKIISENISSDEVIITDRAIEHIKNSHADNFENFSKYFSEIIIEPDYILEANKPNRALLLKEIEVENKKLKLILRLQTSADNPESKNSIVTFQHISDKRFNRYIKNAKILYKNPKLK